MRTLTATIVIFASLLCTPATAVKGMRAPASVSAQGQASDAAGAYTATVGKDEARFTMPVPARDKWKWHMRETKESAREYMMSVKVQNEGQEYSFGFFLWKFARSSEGSGKFSSLLNAGQ